jgi:two-component system, NtrC family, response regulator AtoC
VAEFLSELGHQVSQCDNAQSAIEALGTDTYPLIITDIRMPGIDGIEFLRRIKASSQKEADVIVYTGHGDVDTAIAALRLGAYDYLQKPINVDELALLVERTAEHQSLLLERDQLTTKFDEKVQQATVSLKQELEKARDILAHTTGIGSFLAPSNAMHQVVSQALLYHQEPSLSVVIEGETGTGKELVARLIHFGQSGSSLPFVDINCASLSAELFESELFGYEAGAFTGGKPQGEKGKLALSEDGTLFLDEIGDMPIRLQPKLLRVLQDRTYFPVGGLKKLSFQARVICATNRNLQQMVETSDFRRDLFYRLNVGYIYLPALRDRPDEIVPLAQYFLERESKGKRKAFQSISTSAQKLLRSYRWPGNVRELENTIERTVLCWDHTEVLPEHLSFLSEETPTESLFSSEQRKELNLEQFELPEGPISLEELNKQVVQKAIAKFKGNKSRTAAYLGITRNALYSRLKKFETQN